MLNTAGQSKEELRSAVTADHVDHSDLFSKTYHIDGQLSDAKTWSAAARKLSVLPSHWQSHIHKKLRHQTGNPNGNASQEAEYT